MCMQLSWCIHCCQTVKQYVNCVRIVHLDSELCNPLEDDLSLPLVLWGIARMLGCLPPPKKNKHWSSLLACFQPPLQCEKFSSPAFIRGWVPPRFEGQPRLFKAWKVLIFFPLSLGKKTLEKCLKYCKRRNIHQELIFMNFTKWGKGAKGYSCKPAVQASAALTGTWDKCKLLFSWNGPICQKCKFYSCEYFFYSSCLAWIISTFSPQYPQIADL